MNYAPRITNYQPDWTITKLPPVKEYVPMTALEFKRMSSFLLMVMEPSTGTRKVSVGMKNAKPERRLAGPEPLAPFHPIAQRALPRLRSLEKR